MVTKPIDDRSPYDPPKDRQLEVVSIDSEPTATLRQLLAASVPWGLAAAILGALAGVVFANFSLYLLKTMGDPLHYAGITLLVLPFLFGMCGAANGYWCRFLHLVRKNRAENENSSLVARVLALVAGLMNTWILTLCFSLFVTLIAGSNSRAGDDASAENLIVPLVAVASAISWWFAAVLNRRYLTYD